MLESWKRELEALPADRQAVERRKRIEAALDSGLGRCWLEDRRIAGMVAAALLHFDGARYRLHEWVVMPNHVHVLVTPRAGHSLSEIVQGWKSYTAKAANRLLEREGAFWQPEYYDRAIRDAEHFARAVEYIRMNPVVAGLCAKPEQWPAGSAGVSPAKVRAGGPRSQDDGKPLNEGGTGAQAYADAVAVYLALTVNRQANRGCTISFWDNTSQKNSAGVWAPSVANDMGLLRVEPA